MISKGEVLMHVQAAIIWLVTFLDSYPLLYSCPWIAHLLLYIPSMYFIIHSIIAWNFIILNVMMEAKPLYFSYLKFEILTDSNLANHLAVI